MFRTFVVLVGALVSFTVFSASAQEAVLGHLYGNGVHAYFAGDYTKAFDQLTAAVNGGSRDPRVCYFRGLAYLRLGREPEAVQDFKKGAELESKDLHRSYNVARALERVQGSARQQLETYRVDARLAALEEAEKIRKARFESIKREEERVLRTQIAPAPATPEPAPEEQPAKAVKTDPFGNAVDANKGPEEGKADSGDKAAEKSDEGTEKTAESPEPTPEMSGEKTAEKPEVETPGGDAAEKPALVAEPPADKESDKPATKKESGSPKKSILGALIKGAESGIKKSLGDKVGGITNMVPGKGPGGMPPGGMPPGMMPPGGNGEPVAPPAAADPFAPGGEEKATPPKKSGGEAKDSPFKDEATPPEKPATEKPAADPFS